MNTEPTPDFSYHEEVERSLKDRILDVGSVILGLGVVAAAVVYSKYTEVKNFNQNKD